jgi:hypothetical protein
MTRQLLHSLFISAAAIGLAACGGGGGGVNSTPFVPTPTPPPPPPPPPPPSCPPDCSATTIFPDVTESTNFAVAGYESSGGSSPTLTGTGFSVSYDAVSGFYVFDLPSTQPAGFSATDDYGDSWGGKLVDTKGDVQSNYATVYKPSGLNLTYTSTARASDGSDAPFAWLAFGVPTPAGSVPVTGTATYLAQLQGEETQTNGYQIGGGGTFIFDFGAATLSGHLDPVGYDAFGDSWEMGPYDFVNTVYSAGSTSFSGQLASYGDPGQGSFDGSFTGPNAQELMGRWQLLFLDPFQPTQTLTGFGVFVGKKGP